MAPFPHAKLIFQILESGSNLSEDTDEGQLKIYKLALFKIRENVERFTPTYIPYETILDSLEVFNELSITLVPISLREVGELYQIKEKILPLVEEGLTSVNQAVKIYERERKKTKRGNVQKEDLPQEYDTNVIRFRRIVIELHEHLKEE